MSEHKLNQNHILLNTTSDFRVIEQWVGERVTLMIRRVHYDVEGKPLSYDHKPPKVESTTGDGLVALLNDMAIALTKPSLIETDFDQVTV